MTPAEQFIAAYKEATRVTPRNLWRWLKDGLLITWQDFWKL